MEWVRLEHPGGDASVDFFGTVEGMERGLTGIDDASR